MAFSMALLTSRAGADFLGAGAAQRAVSVSATPTSPGFAAEADPGFRPPARDPRAALLDLLGVYATQPLRCGKGCTRSSVSTREARCRTEIPPVPRNGNRRTR